jgi:hypothetical protein
LLLLPPSPGRLGSGSIGQARDARLPDRPILTVWSAS